MTENAIFNAVVDYGTTVNDSGSVSTMVKDILISDLYEARNVSGVVVDVGSNVGAYSLVAAQHADEVVSVDVSAVAVSAQRDMMRACRADNVKVHCLAVGDPEKTWCPRSTRYVYENTMCADAPETTHGRVLTLMLPGLFAHLGLPDPSKVSMKMNTNGAETHILQDPESIELMSRLKSLALVCHAHSDDLFNLGRMFASHKIFTIGNGRSLLLGKN